MVDGVALAHPEKRSESVINGLLPVLHESPSLYSVITRHATALESKTGVAGRHSLKCCRLFSSICENDLDAGFS
jgi:hypothetical protein